MAVGEAWDQDAVSTSGMGVALTVLCEHLAGRASMGFNGLLVDTEDGETMEVVNEAISCGLAEDRGLHDERYMKVAPTERGYKLGAATHVLYCPGHHRHCC